MGGESLQAGFSYPRNKNEDEAGIGGCWLEEILSDPDYPTLFWHRRGRSAGSVKVGADDENSVTEGGEASVMRDMLKVLLNAMGFEPASEEEKGEGAGTMAASTTVASAKPMSGGKKPEEDPTYVTDFALLQVTMGNLSSMADTGASSMSDGGGATKAGRATVVPRWQSRHSASPRSASSGGDAPTPPLCWIKNRASLTTSLKGPTWSCLWRSADSSSGSPTTLECPTTSATSFKAVKSAKTVMGHQRCHHCG